MELLRTDIHTHLVPAVDDGSRGPSDTVEMLRGLVALGVERVHTTPHQFRFRNDFTVEDLEQQAASVRLLAREAGLAIEIVAGAEYYFSERLLDAVQGGEALCTFETDGEPHLLIELPLNQPAAGVRPMGELLLRRGVRPVMAHPERLVPRLASLDRIRDWVAGGWKLQLNLPSLAGSHGSEADAAARELIAAGEYAFAGSDLHRPSELDALMRARAALAMFV
jgi:tyrosine-protein phosphatase YwqE